ncbi:ROK family protein [Anaerobacillus alkaliphilus]|uniref:ROK family protein n=2 Tax=Anaerobacillus alkaliphilus TaxID=1548597 RepID=A0A4V1LGM7_9BACI|nr:ROK family protein [Anaerobacillus alkaliphilus]
MIGVDLGGTNVRVALVDENGTILQELSRKTEASRGPDFVIGNLIEMINVVQEGTDVASIGIGSPGPLDPYAGVILSPPNLPGWDRVPLVGRLREHFSVPIVLDNDANAAALAEATLGAGQGHKSVYYITWSTGIGGGLVIDGKLFQGAQGYAGEIGNMIIQPGGFQHSNLNAGALEAMASGTAIGREGKVRLGVTGGAEEVFRMAADGHDGARKILDEAVDYLAMGIANLVHTVNPEVFVLGGGVMQSQELVFDSLCDRVRSYVYPSLREHILLKPAALGTKAGIVGAGLLGLSQ